MGDNKKTSNPTIQQGWTLRDEFANSAMQGVMSTYSSQVTFKAIIEQVELVSITSYAIADAMLKQREL